jgi:hypothetical protein
MMGMGSYRLTGRRNEVTAQPAAQQRCHLTTSNRRCSTIQSCRVRPRATPRERVEAPTPRVRPYREHMPGSTVAASSSLSLSLFLAWHRTSCQTPDGSVGQIGARRLDCGSRRVISGDLGRVRCNSPVWRAWSSGGREPATRGRQRWPDRWAPPVVSARQRRRAPGFPPRFTATSPPALAKDTVLISSSDSREETVLTIPAHAPVQ